MKNNGFCDFFFLHGAEPLDQQNVTFCSFGFFSFIGKDLDKEATCHSNLFPFLCVCVCVCAAEPHPSGTKLQRAEHVSTIGCTVGKHTRVSAHPCAHTHTHTHLFHPGWHPLFRQFCIRLLSQYSAIANSVFVC